MSTRDFAFIQSTTEVGGAETVLLNLFRSSEELRRRALIVCLGFGNGDLPARLRELEADVVELRPARLRQPLRLARQMFELRTLLRRRGVRVVVGNGAHPQVIGGVAARLAGAKSVFLVNMIHAPTLLANDPIDALALRGPCDLFLAISRASQETLIKLRPDVETRLLHWGTPVVAVPPAEATAARRELGAPGDEILFGIFGRLQRWKGQDVFIEAATQVARRRADARFAIVGGSVFGLEPEYLDGLKRRVREAGLSERLVFTGFRSDVPRLMAACDVVCHATRVAEPFGMVLVEAMAQSRPVIATRGGGPSEIIEEGRSGLLVRPDDAGDLADAMLLLAEDRARRVSMGQAAAARVAAAFRIETMAEALIGHLGGLT